MDFTSDIGSKSLSVVAKMKQFETIYLNISSHSK
jgi:hypothetical protein